MSTGTVAQVWRYPVKSMRGESLTSSHVSTSGLLGDRAFALFDAEDTRGSAKLRPFSDLLTFAARYVSEPEPGLPLPPVTVQFPDGSVLRSDDDKIHTALSEVLGREVTLRAGGPFVDLAAAHVLTSASLAAAAELAPESEIDVRRYRPNVLLDVTHEAVGFVEDDWIDRTLCLGDDVRLRPMLNTPRCVMTTLPQPDLPADKRVLSSLTRHHRLEVGEYGVRPCAGVYCDAVAGGTVGVGDVWQVEP